MKCKVCGATISENQKFCSQCGSKIDLSKSCAKCGYIFPDSSIKFCPNCGTKVDDNYDSSESIITLAKSKDAKKNTILEKLFLENSQVLSNHELEQIFDSLDISRKDLDFWEIIKKHVFDESQIETNTLKLKKILASLDSCFSINENGIKDLKIDSGYIKELILSGADSSIATENNQTFLHFICNTSSFTDTEIISVLIKGGIDINLKDCNSKTALDYAIRRSENAYNVIKFLIEAGAFVDSDAIYTVCRCNYTSEVPEIIKTLITAGADDKAGYALTSVCQRAHTELTLDIIKILINAGAWVNFTKNVGNYIYKSTIGNLDVDNNHVYEKYYSPLLLVCTENFSSLDPIIIDELIKAGADVNYAAIDESQYNTPVLHFVCKYNKTPQAPEIVEKLIKAGAKVNSRLYKDNYGKKMYFSDGDETALHYVCKYNQTPQAIDIIDLLIKTGAEVVNYSRADPLHLVCKYNQTQQASAIIDLLIKAGADVNKTSYDELTPLMIICKNCFDVTCGKKIIKLLLDNGADIKIKNSKNKRAFDYAKENKNLGQDPEILKLLKPKLFG